MSEETMYSICVPAVAIAIVMVFFFAIRGCNESDRLEHQHEQAREAQLIKDGYELRLVPGKNEPVWTKQP